LNITAIKKSPFSLAIILRYIKAEKQNSYLWIQNIYLSFPIVLHVPVLTQSDRIF